MPTNAPTKSEFWHVLKWGLFAIAILAVLGAVLSLTGVLGTVATAPGRVVNRTLETGNILGSYEYFFDTNAQYVSRVHQIKGHRQLLAGETDPKEHIRLNIELAAMQQSCRDLVTRYDANSAKANKSLFKSHSLPETLDISTCES